MISFNKVPANARVPFAYVEFDSSRAQQGSAAYKYKVLAIGQKLSGGTKASGELVPITNKDQASQYFGEGSQLAEMIKYFLLNNSATELMAIGYDDHASAVKASGTLTITGTATAAGVINLYVAGKKVVASVASGDDADTVAASINSAINADSSLMVDSSVTDNVVTVTAKNGGELGNDIDLRMNYAIGEETPAGVSVAIVQMSGGVQNPDVSSVFTTIGDEHINIFLHAYLDSANLSAFEVELEDRFGPIRQNDGYQISAMKGTYSEVQTFGDGKNSKFLSVMDALGPCSPSAWAGAIAGQVSTSAEIDPAVPFQRLPLMGIMPPRIDERRNWNESNNLLFSGISTSSVVVDKVYIQRVITTYRLNEAGASDTAYLDLNTPLTLSFLRYDYRNTMLVKYPRHKLGKDGGNYGVGSKVVTPSVLKAETIAIFRRWEERGLVEDIDQFKSELLVEINSSDPNRADTLMSPNLINQLRVLGTQIQFLL